MESRELHERLLPAAPARQLCLRLAILFFGVIIR
jgi:hypothetical protein